MELKVLIGDLYFPEYIHKPRIVQQLFDGTFRDCIVLDVCEHEYKICEKVSYIYWANSKKGLFGKGLGRTDDDESKPVRTGLLGEMAFGKVFGEPIDIGYKKGGDNQDFLLGGKFKIDFKCQMWNYGKGLICCVKEDGTPARVDQDVYVFGYVDSEDRASERAILVLVGFMLRKHVVKQPICPGKRDGKHKNYEVHYSDTSPIVELLNYKKRLYGFKSYTKRDTASCQ